MFSNIIVVWDGSTRARRVFDVALEIARRFSSRLKLVAVAMSAEHGGSEHDRAQSLESAQRFYAERGDALIAESHERGVTTELVILAGSHPAEDVVEIARKSGADLIVVGRRGMSPVERLMIGNAADRIVRNAHCPVLVVGDD
ncbi:MAG: universal stress protein [Vulcanimicrobiaceae bacterium]|jgi:nucleotide-binding universal stress UspA family protein